MGNPLWLRCVVEVHVSKTKQKPSAGKPLEELDKKWWDCQPFSCGSSCVTGYHCPPCVGIHLCSLRRCVVAFHVNITKYMGSGTNKRALGQHNVNALIANTSITYYINRTVIPSGVTVHCREGGFWRVMDSQRLLLYRETLLIRLHQDWLGLNKFARVNEVFWIQWWWLALLSPSLLTTRLHTALCSSRYIRIHQKKNLTCGASGKINCLRCKKILSAV